MLSVSIQQSRAREERQSANSSSSCAAADAVLSSSLFSERGTEKNHGATADKTSVEANSSAEVGGQPSQSVDNPARPEKHRARESAWLRMRSAYLRLTPFELADDGKVYERLGVKIFAKVLPTSGQFLLFSKKQNHAL